MENEEKSGGEGGKWGHSQENAFVGVVFSSLRQ